MVILTRKRNLLQQHDIRKYTELRINGISSGIRKYYVVVSKYMTVYVRQKQDMQTNHDIVSNHDMI